MWGTPMETSAGTAGFEKPNLEKAKALLTEAGYLAVIDPIKGCRKYRLDAYRAARARLQLAGQDLDATGLPDRAT